MARDNEPRLGEGRLARWSRLKREAVAEKKKATPPPPIPPEAKTAALAPADPFVGPPGAHAPKPKDPAALLTPGLLSGRPAPPGGGTAPPPDAGKTEEQKKIEDVIKDLPPVESLGKDSDYTAFMRQGVPEEKRVAALRKLWRSDPVYAEPFPLEMHMEDYNATFQPINAATDTIFRAGLGYLFDDDKPEADKPLGKEVADASPPAAIDAGGEKKGDSAESIPPTKGETEKNNMTPPSTPAGGAGEGRSPSGKSHS